MSDNPGLPRKDNDELDNSFEQLVASKRFRDVVEKVKRYTGVNEVTQNQLMNLQGMLMQAVKQVKQIESNNEGYLEQLAVDVVKKELSLPDDAFQYDVELTSMPGKIDMSKMRKDSEEPEDEDVLDQFGVEEN